MRQRIDMVAPCHRAPRRPPDSVEPRALPGVDGRWRTMSRGGKHLTDGTENSKERSLPISLVFRYAATLPIVGVQPPPFAWTG